uniref:universal stress protein n=1 Tax=Paractinoplanes polyasparticus TaxID=2856853 RepID=UPI001C8412A4
MNGSVVTKAVVAYDGSPAANAAIEAAAQMFPRAHAQIAYLWTPPFANDDLRRRLRARNSNLNELVAAIEREGEQEAARLVATGVMLARAAGWDSEPVVQRAYGGEGLHLAQIADEAQSDLLIMGSRGLGAAKAFLGSVSDMAVHYSTRPVLVIPQPLLIDEYEALPDGPVVVGWDGSAGADTASATARNLFPTRDLHLVAVDDITQPAPQSGPRDQAFTAVHLHSGHGHQGRAVADALTVYAREQKAAAIVVGSRGRSALAEIVLGSVAMATLHHAHRPVLVSPPLSRKI